MFFRWQPEFVVGYGNKDYPGYDKLTEAQLLDRAILQRLLEVHAQHAGFPLAEPTLVVKGPLCVTEGIVMISGCTVTEVGRVVGLALTVSVVYAAMNWGTQVAWTETPPPLDAKWSVGASFIGDTPCLFIRSVRRVFFLSPRVPWWQRRGGGGGGGGGGGLVLFNIV